MRKALTRFTQKKLSAKPQNLGGSISTPLAKATPPCKFLNIPLDAPPFDRKRRFQLKKFWSRFGFLAGILGLVLFSTALLLFLNSRYVARFGEPPAIEEAEMAELIVEDRTAPQSVEEVLANTTHPGGPWTGSGFGPALQKRSGWLASCATTRIPSPVQLSRRISGDHLHLTLP